jgi:hypothetical protein
MAGAERAVGRLGVELGRSGATQAPTGEHVVRSADALGPQPCQCPGRRLRPANAVGRSNAMSFDHRRHQPGSPCSVPTFNKKPGIGKRNCQIPFNAHRIDLRDVL